MIKEENKTKDVKILVFGATGFVGRKLVERLLSNGYENIHVAGRSSEKCFDLFQDRVSFLRCDLLDLNAFVADISSYDYIFHCAGEINNEKLMRLLHFESLKDLLSRVSKKSHFVLLSSVGVYGRKRKGFVDEGTGFSPLGLYETTKAEGDVLTREYCSETGICYSIIRPSNIFSWDMPNQSLYGLVREIDRGRFFYFSSPKKIVMNYIHVKNVVDALVSCLSSRGARDEDFIISDFIYLDDFVATIAEALGRRRPVFFVPEGVVRFLVSALSPFFSIPLTSARIDALTGEAVYLSDKARQGLGLRIVNEDLRRGLKDIVYNYQLQKNKGID